MKNLLKEKIQILMDYDIDKNHSNKNLDTAVFKAVVHSNCKIVKFLIEQNFLIDNKNKSACNCLIRAILDDKKKIAKYFIINEIGLNFSNMYENTSFLFSCAKGNLKHVKLILRRG